MKDIKLIAALRTRKERAAEQLKKQWEGLTEKQRRRIIVWVLLLLALVNILYIVRGVTGNSGSDLRHIETIQTE